jgi:hypothetical protein
MPWFSSRLGETQKKGALLESTGSGIVEDGDDDGTPYGSTL